MTLTSKHMLKFYRFIEIGTLFYGTIQNNKIAIAIGFVAMIISEVLLKHD